MDRVLLDAVKSSEFFSLLSKEELKKIIKLMEKVEIKAGEALFLQGSPSDCMYLLVQGMLIAELITPAGEVKTIGTVRIGQVVGEMGLLAATPRLLTVKAVRPSILFKLNKEIFESYFSKNPAILLSLNKTIIQRSEKTVKSLENISHYRNIAFIPANKEVPIKLFLNKLREKTPKEVSVAYLTQEEFKNINDNHTFLNWLDLVELRNDYLIYELDFDNKKFAAGLLERTDRIMIVANGNKPLQMSKLVKEILRGEIYQYTKKELVLLYPDGKHKPRGTKKWLEAGNFSHHHHIRMNRDDDLERLFRFLTGRALGLVLSGGGTRGWMHFGALKALQEDKISIDAIGGTSIGAIVAAAYLAYEDFSEFYDKMIQFAQKMSKPFALRNFTFPLISILNGKIGILECKKLFNDLQIEDLWKPFFCISCNINDSVEVVHRQGPLWQWTRASSSTPGVVPPISVNGKMYVDGGVINNLPVDVMKNLFDGAGKIIAVDLSSNIGTAYYDFPTIITYWDVLLMKLRIGKYRNYKMPDFFNMLVKSLLMGSSKKTIQNALMADIFIKPNLPIYNVIENARTMEVTEIGYQLMKKQLDKLKL